MKAGKNLILIIFFMTFQFLFIQVVPGFCEDKIDVDKCQKLVEKYSSIIDKNPNNYSTYLKRADVEYKLGMYKEAVPFCNKRL